MKTKHSNEKSISDPATKPEDPSSSKFSKQDPSPMKTSTVECKIKIDKEQLQNWLNGKLLANPDANFQSYYLIVISKNHLHQHQIRGYLSYRGTKTFTVGLATQVISLPIFRDSEEIVGLSSTLIDPDIVFDVKNVIELSVLRRSSDSLEIGYGRLVKLLMESNDNIQQYPIPMWISIAPDQSENWSVILGFRIESELLSMMKSILEEMIAL